MTDWTFPVSFSQSGGIWTGTQNQLGITVIDTGFSQCKIRMLEEIREALSLGPRAGRGHRLPEQIEEKINEDD